MEEDVLGLEIAMDDMVAVCVVERAGDRRRYSESFVDWELLLTVEAVAKRFALDERHNVEERSVRRLSRVEERKEIRVLEVGGDADLGEKPLDAHDRGKLWVENLQRDVSVVLEVAREIDRRHASSADLALDCVAIGERMKELVSQLWHRANVTW